MRTTRWGQVKVDWPPLVGPVNWVRVNTPAMHGPLSIPMVLNNS
jgi:hypothetical protein